MSKQKNVERGSVEQMLDRLRAHQTRLVPKTHQLPFLAVPHPRFTSVRSREESFAAQEDQLVALPPLKRTPSVMDLGIPGIRPDRVVTCRSDEDDLDHKI